MQSQTKRILTLEGAMRQALELGQFYLHYQPQLSVDGCRIVGVEALLRWNHPELGTVSPAEFIPLAESNGQIIPIGTWVLREAVQQLRAWLDVGLPPMVMAVNLSAVQFRHSNLPALVAETLRDAQLAPEYLELELTEGVTMANPQDAIEVMDNLHDRGIRMSIDDFGTGYSSLSYLKKFKVYKLKIDQSFVRDIATDGDDRAIVAAIVQMAHSMGYVTIAEGVETPAQQAFLSEQGCDEVQGYLFSKPLPADEIVDFVRKTAMANRS
jgi:EAL domain-containing protein (putative c-di-GMP-specific phosphodiesterase class I)